MFQSVLLSVRRRVRRYLYQRRRDHILDPRPLHHDHTRDSDSSTVIRVLKYAFWTLFVFLIIRERYLASHLAQAEGQVRHARRTVGDLVHSLTGDHVASRVRKWGHLGVRDDSNPGQSYLPGPPVIVYLSTTQWRAEHCLSALSRVDAFNSRGRDKVVLVIVHQAYSRKIAELFHNTFPSSIQLSLGSLPTDEVYQRDWPAVMSLAFDTVFPQYNGDVLFMSDEDILRSDAIDTLMVALSVKAAGKVPGISTVSLVSTAPRANTHPVSELQLVDGFHAHVFAFNRTVHSALRQVRAEDGTLATREWHQSVWRAQVEKLIGPRQLCPVRTRSESTATCSLESADAGTCDAIKATLDLPVSGPDVQVTSRGGAIITSHTVECRNGAECCSSAACDGAAILTRVYSQDVGDK